MKQVLLVLLLGIMKVRPYLSFEMVYKTLLKAYLILKLIEDRGSCWSAKERLSSCRKHGNIDRDVKKLHSNFTKETVQEFMEGCCEDMLEL